jgi:pimeloyl-ACP methyl ester carboxylesterase
MIARPSLEPASHNAGMAVRMAVRIGDVVAGRADAQVEAHVVEPAGREIRAGVLFLHWLGERRSDRTQFLSEARVLARLGVRSVLPAGRLPWSVAPTDAQTDVAAIEVEQLRLGAALDALVDGLPSGAPVALVGHDFGAMHGLLLAARRPVFAAVVVIAATPRWGDWFLRFWQLDVDRFEYLRRLAPFDPIESARRVSAPAVLWQFSERDYYIAPMSAVELAHAAPGEPEIEWFGADHAMRSAKARASRVAFLRRHLGLG